MRLAPFAAALLLAAAGARADVDPLAARIELADAERFAAVFKATNGAPTAEQLQRGYLDGAGRGVAIFTPMRIRDARRLANAIAKKPHDYRHAIETCLPLAASLESELRAIYLGLKGLLPKRPLPAFHIVFGAGTSGGTARPDAQVIGLEVVCQDVRTPDDFRRVMRGFMAHETVHTWQDGGDDKELLLQSALLEGMADYVAKLVTGASLSPQREQWASSREAWLWQQFEADRKTLAGRGHDEVMRTPELRKVYTRWFANFGAAPEGWPYEAGYWVGMRIAEAYVAQAADKRAALEVLIEARDPAAILLASGYAPN